ncbi:MAG: hypothetical protein JO166_01895 [Deltaproteobacteria bacterium]|nr:hypothetical protein [Deltaproteobacteria bacterium]
MRYRERRELREAWGGGSDLDSDDKDCFDASQSTRIRIAGCRDEDADFDGVSYGPAWPGTVANDSRFHPAAIVFRSPLFHATGGVLTNFSQVAFETDLPRIEAQCDQSTGSGCTNPPEPAEFYPFFSTGDNRNLGCIWQIGGALIPGTTNTFGADSTAEFGNLLVLDYPGPESEIEDFRNILSTNPCTAPQVLLTLPGTSGKPIAFGSRKRGTTTSKRLQIANLSDYPVSITTLVASRDYGTTNDQCSGQTLSAGQTCSFIASFSPTVSGPDNGSIIVNSDADNSSRAISITGKGQ